MCNSDATPATPTAVPLVVTTAHRGVFFGYGVPCDGTVIRIERAQMCLYWSEELHGLLGLASEGPSGECKVGPAVPAITLRDVTAVIEATPLAARRWEAEPWS